MTGAAEIRPVPRCAGIGEAGPAGMRGPHGHARIRPCDAPLAPAIMCRVVADRAGVDAVDRSFLWPPTPTAIFFLD
jgi:hypothetical protein